MENRIQTTTETKAIGNKMAPVTKVSPVLLDLLNKGVARELQVSIQYMWQHVQWSGIKGFAVSGALNGIAISEMKHAEAIAERLFYLGGTPTTKPDPIFVGESVKEMLLRDINDEAAAVALYKQIIDIARTEKDVVTEHLFQGLVEQEESHHDTFTTLVEDL